ncbi:hypothetical protein NQ314_020977 [Rhamnusium bicolor]|uniref:Cytochrome P450 n=1 Tax=Rhamnusium bicolor TaxID=1586634 RepID=A0AAV8WJT1_9CUCU|nr:hypothetical protein NQ314_020977 [Rhamnusium bicolor]
MVRAYDYCRRRGLNKKGGIAAVPLGRRARGRPRERWLYNEDLELGKDGGYSGAYQFFSPTIVIKDPELLKQVTVKDFDHFTDHRSIIPEDADPLMGKNLFALKGQKWRDMRAILSPSFTSSKMRVMFALMAECAENFVQHFLKKDEEVVTVEFKDIFTRYTNDVIATTAFGIKVDSLGQPNNEFYLMGKEATNFGFWKTLKFLGFALLPKLYELLKVSLFGSKGKIPTELTDLDITAQALIFFFAGFETVSTNMSFAAYELAANPDIQDKLRKEINATLEECGGQLTYEGLLKMKYLDMVISEALRKWPNAVAIDRVCTKPYTINPVTPEEKPLYLEKGSLLLLPIFAIHRDPENYPNPDRFDPERFSDENKGNINPYTYCPFGLGPRNFLT